MKFLRIFYLLIQIMLAGGCYLCKSQTPANDLNWVLDTGKSDEFNSVYINKNKWHILDCPSGDCCNWGGGTAFEKGNSIDSGGILQLRSDGPGFAPIPCNRGQFATGGLSSDSANYSYGYFEMYAKLPGFYYNGTPYAGKFQPSLWLAYSQSDTSCTTIHNEIDVLLPGPLYTNASINQSAWSYQKDCSFYIVKIFNFYSRVPLFLAYHKYAFEWNTNKLIFLFDDVPYSENYNSPTFTMHPLWVYIQEGLADTTYHFSPGTTFPQYMSVDYFRYYKLNLDCGTSSILLTNTDLAAYVYSVKSDITFGDGTNSISLNSTDKKYFRAVNTITINGTFTAPLGSELGLLPTACN
ncbi:MAG TPA: glycoside hydrolase family 16 protein [Bacteroidia bacterium]|jgi:beta-glucanase (GH16 family)|nr:glycoside hydrolase family 16 protein [Bacteroidia bacterium]